MISTNYLQKLSFNSANWGQSKGILAKLDVLGYCYDSTCSLRLVGGTAVENKVQYDKVLGLRVPKEVMLIDVADDLAKKVIAKTSKDAELYES